MNGDITNNFMKNYFKKVVDSYRAGCYINEVAYERKKKTKKLLTNKRADVKIKKLLFERR